MALTEAQIRRYARHVLLPDVGGVGQQRLLDATVTLDVTSPAAAVTATYLAAAGVGALALRGAAPALVARLRALNPDVRISDTPADDTVHCTITAADFVAGGKEACRIVWEIVRS